MLSLAKYRLALCELHYTPIHGKTIYNSDKYIEGHYIIIKTFLPLNQNYHNAEDLSMTFNKMLQYSKSYRKKYNNLLTNNLLSKCPHICLRNYLNIISKKKYIMPEIVECIVLPTQEIIAIKKTFWIKIIQRTWKKIFYKRNKLFADPLFIRKYQLRQISSKDIPGIRGMLMYP